MSAFSGITNYLDNNQADILCKATVLEKFNYCPLIWMFSFKATNREINRTYRQALWVLHKDNLSFDKCLMKEAGIAIHLKNLHRLIPVGCLLKSHKLMLEVFKTLNYLKPLVPLGFV